MLNLENLDKNALNDEELEDVTGGKRDFVGTNNGKNPVTKMKCKNCGYELDWVGKFEGKSFTCRRCQTKNALEGIDMRK